MRVKPVQENSLMITEMYIMLYNKASAALDLLMEGEYEAAQASLAGGLVCVEEIYTAKQTGEDTLLDKHGRPLFDCAFRPSSKEVLFLGLTPQRKWLEDKNLYPQDIQRRLDGPFSAKLR